MSPQLICLWASTKIPLGPASGSGLDSGWWGVGGSAQTYYVGASHGTLEFEVHSSWIPFDLCSSVAQQTQSTSPIQSISVSKNRDGSLQGPPLPSPVHPLGPGALLNHGQSHLLSHVPLSGHWRHLFSRSGTSAGHLVQKPRDAGTNDGKIDIPDLKHTFWILCNTN